MQRPPGSSSQSVECRTALETLELVTIKCRIETLTRVECRVGNTHSSLVPNSHECMPSWTHSSSLSRWIHTRVECRVRHLGTLEMSADMSTHSSGVPNWTRSSWVPTCTHTRAQLQVGNTFRCVAELHGHTLELSVKFDIHSKCVPSLTHTRVECRIGHTLELSVKCDIH